MTSMQVREARQPGTRRSVRVIASAVIAALIAAMAVLTGALPASAAPGDYTVQLDAPASIPIWDPFTYTATIDVEASAAQPATGIVLTAVLAEGLQFDSVPTGPDSPVASASYDAATRTVTFTLRDLQAQLSSFAFSVRQIDSHLKSPATVYDTTLSGTPTPSGATPSDSAHTTLTGVLNYHPQKSYTTIVGSNNRDVTYYFNVVTTDVVNDRNFYTWSQTLTDVLPAGAVVTASSTWGAPWTFTSNPDGTTTATWHREGPYGASGWALDANGGRIWLVVSYPPSHFPDGTQPPTNEVSLSVTDRDGVSYAQPSASTQSPAIADGQGQSITMTKSAWNGSDDFVVDQGGWMASYLVKIAYLSSVGDPLESLTVDDTSTHSAGNATFFDHFETYRLRMVFNPTLQAVGAEFDLQYTTNAGGGWNDVDTSGMTTAMGELRLITQTAGSVGFVGEGGYDVIQNIPVGQWITGWRVVVSPESGTTVPSGSEVRVEPQGMASFSSLTDGSAIGGPVVNTATASGTTVGGVALGLDDSTTMTIRDRVNLITSVGAPSSIDVGESADFTATISNLDPSGRSYPDSVMRVVLPVGVVYDPAVGVSPAYATTPVTGLTVPEVGDGLSISTDTVVDADGREHQVVVFEFDDLPSLRTAGQPKHRDENLGFRYTIPTRVLPQAYNASNLQTEATSWAYTDDASLASIPMSFYGTFYAADVYDFSATLDHIARGRTTTTVTTAGGLLIGKQVRADSSQGWGLTATVASPGTAEWQLYLVNVLPQPVSGITLFDRLPAAGDGRDSDFGVTLSGAVQGLPAGAVAEYSVDATSATTGTWTTDPVGASAIRVTVPSLATGESFDLTAPTSVPSGAGFAETATNNAQATGTYLGAVREFASNDASITSSGDPAFTLVKRTNGAEFAAAPGAVVATGSTVTWTYEVTNTGDTPLDTVAVSDVFTAGDGSTGALTPTSTATGVLAPGESRVFTATAPAVAGQYHNTAEATARAVDDAGAVLPTQPDAQTDESWYLAGDAGMTIEKTTNGESIDTAPGVLLTPGDDVEWEYTVTNTGGLPLTDVVVVDVAADGTEVFRQTVPSIAAGASVTLSATGTAISGQYENTVTATVANPLGGPAITVSDQSWYFGVESALAVEKLVSASPDGPWTEVASVTTGDSSYWQITVTNEGNVPLTDVRILDDQLGETVGVGDLEVGESSTVVLTLDKTTAGLTNTATAEGTDPLQVTVEDSDDATVQAVPEILAITGAVVASFLALGLVLTAGGVLLFLVRRRQRQSTEA